MGSKYLTKLNGGMMDKLMYVCGIVGLMVIGAMVASMVGLTTPITFASTGLVLQDVLNSILPNLLNLGIVMLMYTLIRKKVKTGWLLGICIVGGVPSTPLVCWCNRVSAYIDIRTPVICDSSEQKEK